MINNVIIVAGGKGLRMGSDLPKQFIPIGGKPVLMHTIEAFYNFDQDINIILVLPLSHQNYWQELCEKYNFKINHTIANGGQTRFHSVKNGLSIVKEGIVGVQDGVRPFASKEMIQRCFDAAEKYPAVIPVIDSTDSLREMVDDEKSKIVDRSKIRLVQTPQVFHFETLKEAYQTDFKETFTDDASVVESMGIGIHLVKGEVTNIKITTPLDLKIGEVICLK
ncbi:MAG: 2-C-methyl-D-erythritol 4-phosphate cytidylyltransferase [Prevotella sp.]|jgi:2-C-methyl-D-erythritol 4-phosphate cytidylyltransferase|nr:2-C-methyl-D-erythritol 4-phosphate cytidylyltransferase [Prevotella sp.]